jgi:GNAT superfamily N-acetyltransferase
MRRVTSQVGPEFRRQGVASALLENIEEAEGAEGALVCLFVSKDNVAALNLYSKAGYTPIEADLARQRYKPLLGTAGLVIDELSDVMLLAKCIRGDPVYMFAL